MKVQNCIHYLQHPLADIWTGITVLADDSLTIVDSGTAAAVAETILPYLRENRLHSAGQPAIVINTHCHCDHIGGNAGLKAALAAAVWVHEADAAFTADRAAQFDALFGPFSRYERLAMNPAGFRELAGADTVIDRHLCDGDRLQLGRFTFTVLHIPGHTAGSIALYEPTLGLLLAGDSLQADGTTDTKVPLITDLAAYRRSLARLRDLEISLLIADHPFKPFPVALFRGAEAATFIRDSLEIAECYAERVSRLALAQPSPFALLDIGSQLAREVDLNAPNPYVLILAAACLDDMAAAGRLHRLSGEGWQPTGTFSSH